MKSFFARFKKSETMMPTINMKKTKWYWSITIISYFKTQYIFHSRTALCRSRRTQRFWLHHFLHVDQYRQHAGLCCLWLPRRAHRLALGLWCCWHWYAFWRHSIFIFSKSAWNCWLKSKWDGRRVQKHFATLDHHYGFIFCSSGHLRSPWALEHWSSILCWAFSWLSSCHFIYLFWLLVFLCRSY